MGVGIYLVGKIAKHGWRDTIVSGGLRGEGPQDYDHLNDIQWPRLEKAIFDEFDYTGPYFCACDHGCFHGRGTHALGKEGYCYDDSSTATPKHGLSYVSTLCSKAIRDSDIVFAWIDSLDAFGSLAEIGYARAAGLKVWIASPVYVPDLWFVYSLAHQTLWCEIPHLALKRMLESWRSLLYNNFESPIEEMFWNAASLKLEGLIPQYHIGKFRVDFAIPDQSIAIELDGHNYHKTKQQRTRDADRERQIELGGWKMIRFTGTEVYKDANKCVDYIASYIEKLIAEACEGLPALTF